MSSETAFNHVGHCVSDLARGRRFYVELFGFEVERELAVPDAPADQLLRIEAPLGYDRRVPGARTVLVLELLQLSTGPATRRPGCAP